MNDLRVEHSSASGSAKGYRERCLSIPCGEATMIGIASVPVHAADVGVLIVVGGPQYRVGSHRQFVLLARHLAANGFPVLRFDYRGMGDSEGEARTFENIEVDIKAALDALFRLCPSVRSVALWGLCDGASAAAMYAKTDPRVKGLVLLNPWVRSEQSLAQTYLRHYYWDRLRSPQFWSKLGSGSVSIVQSARDLLKNVVRARSGPGSASAEGGAAVRAPAHFLERMREGLRGFKGEVLIVLSGRDLTAQEFSALVIRDPAWQSTFAALASARCEIESADHTFSRAEWRAIVEARTLDWLKAKVGISAPVD